MIVYEKAEHREKMAEVIQLMGMDLEPLVAWELAADGERIVHDVKLGEIRNDKDEFTFKGVNLGFKGSTIFFYSRGQALIFKTSLIANDGNIITVKLPDIVKVIETQEKEKMEAMIKAFQASTTEPVLEEVTAGVNEDGVIIDSFGFANNHPDKDWLTSLMSDHDAELLKSELSYITLDEEDEMFEGVRAAPRAKPPEGKMITVQVENDARPQSSYMLYDLSQGGLSFLVFTKDEFTTGEKVHIKAFDTRKFEKPIVSEVKAVREADELGIQFKVGCEFLDIIPES